MLDNIGVPYSSINLPQRRRRRSRPPTRTSRRLEDGAPAHRRLLRTLRARLRNDYPDTPFFFLPADIFSQVLNFGLPAPIDVQVVGPT